MNTSSPAVVFLKVLTALGMAVAVLFLPILWFVSEDLAATAPEFAGLRWPYLLIGAALVVCVEVVGTALWKLLSRVAAESIFDTEALAWVNAIIGAGCAAVVLFALALTPVAFVTHGPPALSLALILAAAMSAAFTLLMIVMRQLLIQATSFSDEMAEVI